MMNYAEDEENYSTEKEKQDLLERRYSFSSSTIIGKLRKLCQI